MAKQTRRGRRTPCEPAIPALARLTTFLADQLAPLARFSGLHGQPLVVGLRASSVRLARSRMVSLPCGSTSFSNLSRIARRAGRVRAARSSVLAHETLSP
jgi:hypothetical protein